MPTPNMECPRCRTAVAGWSARCPRCGFHPDCDCHNRAQDDVAMIARYHPVDRQPADGHGWRRFLPNIFGGKGAPSS